MIAAYRLAASKMIAGGYYVTMYKGNDLNEVPMRCVGEYHTDRFGQLQLTYFPYAGPYFRIIETNNGLLFSADSVFAGGNLSYIAESGRVGDYIDSLTRLRYFGLQALYPGHGRVSLTPIGNINHAIAIAQRLLENRQSGEPEFFLSEDHGELSELRRGSQIKCL